MDKPIKSSLSILFISISIVGFAIAETAPLESAVETKLQAQKEAVSSQKTVDSLVEQTKDSAQQYREAISKSDSLETYNNQLAKLIKQQKEDLASIQRQLDNVEETQRNIVPLMLKMIDTLDKFVKLDIPFLKEERQQRIAFLKEIMDRPDVTLPDKYRRIMEAYQIEMEYGRTIETYTDTVKMDGQEYTVDILRVGRLLMTFQTLDGAQSGLWDKESKSWQKLSSQYNRSINKGLQIAKKQAPPELIKLPVNVAGK
jgi:DNA repair exonuclease SbcCD ATPase subunit